MTNDPDLIPIVQQIGPNGTLTGRHLDEFISNPKIWETTEIPVRCSFNQLDIEGPLYVSNLFDDVDVDEVLSDVVYKHEPSPKINSMKRFTSIQAPDIQITSNLVNDIPFSSFVTKDTEQTFNVKTLPANVFFEHLNVDGLFQWVNVTDLDYRAIKLFGDQYTNAELEFEDGDFLNIDADQLVILDQVNGINVCDNFAYLFS